MHKIIILHGWTYSTEKWQPLIRKLEQKGYQVEMPAIPALTAPIQLPWDINDYQKWLGHILSRQNQKVILICHSNGGRIASYYLSKNPEMVSKLILIDSAGIFHNDFLSRGKRFIFKQLARYGKVFTKSEKMRKLLYRFARESDYFQADPNTRITMTNLISRDYRSNFGKIDIPTTIIWGQHDQQTPISDGKIIHSLIKNSSLQIIDGARHSPFYTHTDQVCNIIEQAINN